MSEAVIATRGSQLARTQSEWIAARLREAHPGLTVRLLVVQTSGDKRQDLSLPEIGGKGAFTREVQEAMLEGRAHLAVHSLKDLPTAPVPGLRLWAYPKREDPRDAWIGKDGLGFKDLRAGHRVATGALRREAQLRHAVPGLQILPIRGNVDTRLAKFDAGEFDGLLLAAAGLRRLGLENRVTEYLEPTQWLPAPGQGILAVEGPDDPGTRELLSPLDHAPSRSAAMAERAFLATLEAGCHVPVGALALVDGERLHLRGLMASVDGARVMRGEAQTTIAAASKAGQSLAERLLHDGGEALRAGWNRA